MLMLSFPRFEIKMDSHASFRCHGALDENLTPTGDVAVIYGDYILGVLC